VQRVLARVLSGYLRWTLSTIRWRWIGREAAEQVWDGDDGAVVCFWHGRILLSPACWPLGRAQDPRALVSLSPDGEFIARAMGRLGFPAIRGSSAKKSDPAKAKGGAAAFRDVLKWLRAGGGVAITPDGPRGPAETMTEAPAMLAGISGAPALLVGLACRPCLRLNSWDRAVVPLPFGRGAIVWDGPVRVDGRASATALEPMTREWAQRLTAVTERAEAALA
jgi:lysophospholipid acyltransferase (LPLAT)-like uncharacterized protein